MNYDIEFLSYIEEILDNSDFKKRKNYMHHENQSVYDHSINVAYRSYLYAKKHNLDKKSISIGGLLHDFYYNPWQDNRVKKKFKEMHGFVHAKEALENARKIFPDLMNDIIENIILRHMFPLNIIPPKYKESWVVTYMDKISSIQVLKHPKEYPKYLGIRKKK
ncbi:MAG: HD domain-containing protein [Bacilli bacterium]